jgi:hypothetical protein
MMANNGAAKSDAITLQGAIHCIWGGSISLVDVSVNRTLHDNPPIGRIIEALETLIRERGVVATIELSRQFDQGTVFVEPATPDACAMGAWLDVPNGAIHVLLGSDQVPYESVVAGALDDPEFTEIALSQLRVIFEAVVGGRYRQEL